MKIRVGIIIAVIIIAVVLTAFGVYLYFLGREISDTNTNDTNITDNTNATNSVNNNITNSTNLNTNTTVNTATLDTDNDGLTDSQEINVYGTDPEKADTDGDGYWDGVEIATGNDPLVANVSNTNSTTNTNTANTANISLSTSLDKEVYQAKDSITLAVKLNSDEDVNNVLVKSAGVRGKSSDYFNKSQTVNLKAGEEQAVSLTTILPSCSSCSGVTAGTYSITTTVYVNNQEVETNTISFVLQE